MNATEEDSQGDASTYHIHALAPPSVEELNSLVPAYEFLEFLDHGGMGVVYKARQKSLNRIVAVKMLPPANQNRRTFAERFKREAEALALLNHPNIVAVYDSGETANGVLYYVMEFVKGSNLRRMIKSGRLSTQRMLAVVTQVCGALQYAHDRGVVHRDIKPGNILLDEDDNAKVADFGLAKVLGLQRAAGELTSALDPIGTPDYIAPEVLTGETEVDHRADIYSLGVMLYEMSTGHVPKGAWEPPSRCGADSRLDEVVSRALQIDPQHRYQRINDLTQELQPMLKHGDLPTSGSVHTGPKAIVPLAITPMGERGLANPDAAIPVLPRAARRAGHWMRALRIVLLGLGGVGILLWQSPSAREWLGIQKKPVTVKPIAMTTTASPEESPPKVQAFNMQDQRELAQWVFAHGGLINVTADSQARGRLSDDDGYRGMERLPKDGFIVRRISFSEDESFSDNDLAGLMRVAEKAQSVTHLALRGTSVTPSGLRSLPTLKLTLTNLNIRNTSAFSAQSIPFIAACGQLKRLFITIDIAQPQQTIKTADRELVAKLQALLPDCEIFAEKPGLTD